MDLSPQFSAARPVLVVQGGIAPHFAVRCESRTNLLAAQVVADVRGAPNDGLEREVVVVPQPTDVLGVGSGGEEPFETGGRNPGAK